PLIVEAVAKLRPSSRIIDGEAVACGEDAISEELEQASRHCHVDGRPRLSNGCRSALSNSAGQGNDRVWPVAAALVTQTHRLSVVRCRRVGLAGLVRIRSYTLAQSRGVVRIRIRSRR